MNIDPNWDLETAFYEISSRYGPGSYFQGRTSKGALALLRAGQARRNPKT